ncbi:CDI toxin immunity protein, partial [Tenacibaculum maritimum]
YFDSEYCYIFWNDESLPVIKTKFNLFLKNIDDVLAVSYDTWILSNSEKIIIEFFHDDIISVINIPAPASL